MWIFIIEIFIFNLLSKLKNRIIVENAFQLLIRINYYQSRPDISENLVFFKPSNQIVHNFWFIYNAHLTHVIKLLFMRNIKHLVFHSFDLIHL